ncbi:MAG: LamG domain-containing protein [Planctomycetota bacterium]
MDIISSTVAINGEWRFMEAANSTEVGGPAIVNITDSDVTVNGEWRWADKENTYGIVNMSGGSVTCSSLKMGDEGRCELNMSGLATVTVNGDCDLHGREDPITLNMQGGLLKVRGRFQAPGSGTGGGNVTINLDAGTIDCGEFENENDEPYAMDINEGIMLIDGNDVAHINSEITLGYITAYDGEAGSQVHVAYDEVSDKTKVWATTVHKKAWNPTPENSAKDICPGIELRWASGAFVADVNGHDIYFGTSFDDVNASATPYREGHDNNSWPSPSLDLGKIYYWRVDEVNDACSPYLWKGNIWQFTTNDGNAFNPYPAHSQTRVAVDANVSWTPGCTAGSHNVYFGTDYNDVRDGTGGTSKGNQPLDANEYDPNGFGYLTVYYWRIDEVDDGNTFKGEIWSFRSQADIEDPNLILWYTFDENEPNTIAHDSSGYENHGPIVGAPDPAWEPNGGRFDGCLKFRDANGYRLAVPSEALDPIDKGITVTVWVNGHLKQDEGDDMTVFDGGDLEEGNYKLMAIVPAKRPALDVYWRAGNDSNDALAWDVDTWFWRGKWHHLGFVKDENAGTMKIYFDGEMVHSKTGTTNSLANVRDKLFSIGSHNYETKGYEGKLDDFRIYDYALPDGKIAGVFRGEDLALAWGPSPYDGQPDAPRDANLGWKPGEYADSHDVYFGTDYEDVRDANTTVTLGVFKDNQSEIVYDLNLLDLDTTFYWRIDEVNDNNGFKWKGKVWRFTTVDFLIIDDMESYVDSEDLYWTWVDGRRQEIIWGGWYSGSMLYLGERPLYEVHSGDKVMRYGYFIGVTPLPHAEAWLPLPADKRDWTREDVRILLLYFYGMSTNDATDNEQMYVGVEDTNGTYAEIRYGDYRGEDMNDINEPEWHSWYIALEDFNDPCYAEVPNDVNVKDVNRLYIGFGNRRASELPPGEGEVKFDDIRLNLPVCRADIIQPVGDFTGRRGEPDCIVDLADVGYVADYWLMTDVNLVGQIQKPNDANLLGWWKLDDGTGGTATDSSGYNNSGTIETIDVNVWWVTGRADVNYALEFDGGRVLVPDGGATPELRPEYRVSVCAWVYHSEAHYEHGRIVSKGKDNKETYALGMDDKGKFGFFVRDVNYKSYDVVAPVWQDEWLHLAGTYDGDSNTVKGYLNGLHVGVKTDANFVAKGWTLSQDTRGLAIGNPPDINTSPFLGIIDDVRVYDYALAEAEVMWLASDGTGYTALTAPANLYYSEAPGQQAINYRDIAVLINHWLEKKKWPWP